MIPIIQGMKNVAHTLVWCSVILAGFVGRIESTERLRLSLSDAVSLAIRHNETLLIALEDEKRASGVVKEAWAGALPNVAFQGTYQGNLKKPAFFAPEEFGGGKFEIGEDIEVLGNLRIDQVLYAFGRVGNAVQYANIFKEMAAMGVGNARSEVTFSAKEAYFRVLLMQHVVDIQRQFLNQARSHLADIEVKFSQGTTSRFTLLRAQVEVKNREPEVISAENDLTLALQDLKRVLGLDDTAECVLTDSLGYVPYDIREEVAINEALSHRPEIRTLELNVEGRKKILAIEKAGRLPLLGLYGQVLLQGQAGKEHPLDPFDKDHRAISASAGLSLSMPIFDGFRSKGKVQQARASLYRAEYELQQARKAVRLEVTKAVQDLRSLRREYESQRATVDLAQEAYTIAETRFLNGLSTQLELTDAETALHFARTNFAETLYRYNAAVANMERVLGRTARGSHDDASDFLNSK
ncbi:MAG: TolC family protein [Gemmatimonadota bacterium]|nr:MAG: TolC family protein [Gemmatimonadota bacterium]